MNIDDWKKLLEWAVGWAVVGILGSSMINMVYSYLPVGRDDSDSEISTQRSGLTVRTDYTTGVQYLETTRGHLTVRLKVDGSLHTMDD